MMNRIETTTKRNRSEKGKGLNEAKEFRFSELLTKEDTEALKRLKREE